MKITPKKDWKKSLIFFWLKVICMHSLVPDFSKSLLSPTLFLKPKLLACYMVACHYLGFTNQPIICQSPDLWLIAPAIFFPHVNMNMYMIWRLGCEHLWEVWKLLHFSPWSFSFYVIFMPKKNSGIKQEKCDE